jgi:predicted PurR-regulated permease PerM
VLILFAGAVCVYALWLMSERLEKYGASYESMLGPAVPVFLLVVLIGIVGAVGLRAS